MRRSCRSCHPAPNAASRAVARLALCAALAAGGLLAIPVRAESVDSPPDATQGIRPTATTPAPLVRAAERAVDSQVAELGHTVAVLSSDVERLQVDNERLANTNQRLTELNAQLRQEVEALGLELQNAHARANQRWVLYGAGLLFVGLLTGVLIKARPRRSAWS